MHQPVAFRGTQHGALLLATVAWTMLGVVLLIWVPLAAPVLLALTAIAPLTWSWVEGRTTLHPTPAPIVALALTGLYLLINTSWSLSPASAHTAVFAFFLFVGSTYLTRNALHNTGTIALRAMAIGFYAAIGIAACAVLFEAVTQQWSRRLLMSYVPALRPDAIHMVTDARDWVTVLQPYLINRSIAALALLMWPAALVAGQLAAAKRRYLYLLPLLPLLGAIFASHHATSKIAVIGSTVVFLSIAAAPRLGKRALAFAWILAWLLVVPAATLAYRSQLYLADWLPFSGQHRIVIWGLTAQEIGQAPLLGAGISTGRAVSGLAGYDADYVPGTKIPLGLAIHSHNVYLQTWYEAGAVGVFLLMMVGLLLLRSIGRAPSSMQPYLYATFASCALMGSSSFSLWQPWFMASFGLAAAFAILGIELGKGAPLSKSVDLASPLSVGGWSKC